MKTLRLIAAFMRRDFYHDISYRFAFAMDAAGFMLMLALWFFVAKFLDKRVTLPGGEAVDYFPYVFMGLAALRYVQAALHNLSRRIRNEQTTGTLEATLAAPVSLPAFAAGMLAWDFVAGTLQIFLYAALAAWFFALPVHPAGILAFALALTLVAAMAAGLGMLSAAFIVALKRGDPVNFLITTSHALLGGVFFPVEVLPAWLAPLGKVLPLTYALDAMRGSLLLGKGVGDLSREFIILAATTAALLALGAAALQKAVAVARRSGSLGQY